MGSYARGTTVPVEKTESEIKALLKSAGATKTMSYEDDEFHVVAFEIQFIAYQIRLPKPDPADQRFSYIACGRGRTAANAAQREQKIKQEIARRMRALGALIKARVVAVDEGITTIERAFVGDIVVGGQTMADYVLPQVHKAIEAGQPVGVLALPRGER